MVNALAAVSLASMIIQFIGSGLGGVCSSFGMDPEKRDGELFTKDPEPLSQDVIAFVRVLQ